MDDNMILVEDLKQTWRNLGFEVKKNKKIKIEMFETVFSQTYSLLSKCLTENTIDKIYVPLIAEAFLFANIKDETLDSTCLAAFVLTERMLNYCAFSSLSVTVEALTIYIAEARKDVRLDFGDVGTSISKLAKVFEEIYWKKVNH